MRFVILVASIFILPLTEGVAHAKKGKGGGQALSAAQTNGGANAPTVKIDTFTIYTPKSGGINGSCGGGAYGHGVQICKQLLEPYVKNPGQKYVAGAVPCKGSTAANAFGGAYQSEEVKQAVGSSADQFIIGAVDHYKCGGSGKGGMAGSDGTERMDIAADKESSKEAQAVSKLKGATLRWVGKFSEFQAGRQVQRNPMADVGWNGADSPLGKVASLSEERLKDLLYRDRITRDRGRRAAVSSQEMLAWEGELPWMVVGRKTLFDFRRRG